MTTMQEVASSRTDIYLEPKFLELADLYLPLLTEHGPVPHRAFLAKKLEKINQSEFFVPVLGIQGTGKSSLLNALLMHDLVLPVDADETTCIPVEIRYGEREGECQVHFKDSNQIDVLDDAAGLEQYVHNAYNPGNEKNISHIVVLSKNELLADNLVLVDLPGVGSMTVHNVETTMRYVERLTAAIFLLRTTPPITRSEKIFLTNVWPKLTTAWFIQNQWNDESRLEVEDGKEHNLKTLTDIQNHHNTGGSIEVHVMNVYKALQARLEGDENAYHESGIQALRELLQNMSRNWKSMLMDQFHDSFLKRVQGVSDSIVKRLADLSLTREERQAQYRAEEEAYEAAYRQNRKRIEEIEEKIAAYRLGFMEQASSQSRIQTENLRNEMRRVIRGGVVDGELLSRSYRELADDIVNDLLEVISLRIFEIQKELQSELEHLEIKQSDGTFINTRSFQRESSFKFEKAIPWVTGAAGAWAGVQAGVYIGGLIAGPVGAVAGAIAGLGISAIAGWLGLKGKKKINEVRQKYTLQDLEEPLRQFQSQVKTGIEQVADDTFSQIEVGLEQFRTMQFQMMQAEKQQHEENLRSGEDFHQQMKDKLEHDVEWIKQYEVKIIDHK